jgi:hypothetical protein
VDIGTDNNEKKTNALRRRYQRTRNNEELREKRNTSKARHGMQQPLKKKKSVHGRRIAT